METAVKADVQPVKRGRWYSASTWAALAILLVYAIFTFVFPLIPIVIVAGSMEDLVLYVAPVLGLVLWLAGMAMRILVRRTRNQLIGTSIRYAVVAFGGAGLLVLIIGMGTPGYIRATARFQRQMQKEADVPAIRAWAQNYEPTSQDQTVFEGESVFVRRDRLPDCIVKLKPGMVQFSLKTKTVHLIFGGGFGHWGLTVGPKGTPPHGDYCLPLEDGAWVWHEIQ